MFQSYYLNIDSSWKHFPWKKISTRVVLLQKKIFEAARKNNKLQIYKIQNYLLNCNEAKIFAIENIINSINNYYDFYNEEKYICSDEEKFIIFKYIFSIYSQVKILKSKVLIIIEKIKQYLIYLCLQPEWQARFNYNIVLQNKYFTRNPISNFYLIEVCNINIKYYSNFNFNHLIDKLKSLPYIQKHIQFWFQNRYFTKKKSFCLLSNLLKKIWLLGLDWYKFVNINFNNKYINKKIDSKYLDNYFFNHEIDNICNIIHYIKSKLFQKNDINQWKFNKSIKYFIIINYIINYFKKSIIVYSYHLYYKLIKKIFLAINIIIYYLKLKKNSIYATLHKSNLNIYIFIYQQILLILEYNYLYKVNR